jgi:hypothetical protein
MSFKLQYQYVPLVILILMSISILFFTAYKLKGQKLCVTRPQEQIADNEEVSDIKSYPHFAIGVKTGKDVALTRPLIQQITFLEPVKNIKFFVESPGIMIGNHQAIDVVSSLSFQI